MCTGWSIVACLNQWYSDRWTIRNRRKLFWQIEKEQEDTSVKLLKLIGNACDHVIRQMMSVCYSNIRASNGLLSVNLSEEHCAGLFHKQMMSVSTFQRHWSNRLFSVNLWPVWGEHRWYTNAWPPDRKLCCAGLSRHTREDLQAYLSGHYIVKDIFTSASNIVIRDNSTALNCTTHCLCPSHNAWCLFIWFVIAERCDRLLSQSSHMTFMLVNIYVN